MIIIFSKPFIFLKCAHRHHTALGIWLLFTVSQYAIEVFIYVYRKMKLRKAKLIQAKPSHSPDDFSCMHISVFMPNMMKKKWRNSIHCLARVTDLTGEKKIQTDTFLHGYQVILWAFCCCHHKFFTRSANWKIDGANMNHTHSCSTAHPSIVQIIIREIDWIHRFVVAIHVFFVLFAYFTLAKNRMPNYYYMRKNFDSSYILAAVERWCFSFFFHLLYHWMLHFMLWEEIVWEFLDQNKNFAVRNSDSLELVKL